MLNQQEADVAEEKKEREDEINTWLQHQPATDKLSDLDKYYLQ